MCRFVNAVLPDATPAPALTSIAAEHHLSIEPVFNPSACAQLRRGEGWFRIGSGPCDCDTPLGSRGVDDTTVQAMARRVAKLRRRGWSDARVDRWREQKFASRDRRTSTTHGPSALDWATFLRSALGTGETAFLGILVHWYTASLESEEIRVDARRIVAGSEISPDLLLDLEHEILYEFRSFEAM